MVDLWDIRADCITKNDNLREIYPLVGEIKKDNLGFTRYIFSKTMFRNPKYTIPDDDFELFQKFLDGGSREYPSDGNLPVDIAASEARLVLDEICDVAKDSNHELCNCAREELSKQGLSGLTRGTIKLYLGSYTTRDWRRKRFTDDIDFWIFNKQLLEHALKKCGWRKNKKTKEYEKVIKWLNYKTRDLETTLLIASNDTDQKMDFGAGSFLEGSTLKNIFKKKLQRGHDVDLSDIINVAIVNNREEGALNEEWVEVWNAFEEVANMRCKRATSNIISLCRLSFGIADYLERVANAIKKYQYTVLEHSKYPDKEIIRVCKISSHHLNQEKEMNPNTTRNRIYNNLTKQKIRKLQYARNLRNFANKVLDILNSKYENARVIFEIEK